GVVTFILGEYLDTIVIFAALAVNLAIAAFQKRRTGKVFSTLTATQEKFAFVMRGGQKKEIRTTEIVPGDILLLEAGQSVGADARLIKTRELSVDESVITGEWLAVSKNAEKTVPRDSASAGQINMVWMGTLVASGSGSAVVVATGRRTRFGEIVARTLSVSEEKTPLQKDIRRIAALLSSVIFVLVGVLFAAGIVAGESFGTIFLLAVAIAVAAVPSGLPAAVTVVLAFGMESILKKGGLMRNLLGTETLGSTTVILADKTGTITEAKMRVSAVATATSLARIEAEPETANRAILIWNEDERSVLFHAVAASDAFVEWNLARKDSVAEKKYALQNAERVVSDEKDGKESSFLVRGRPIERAVFLGGIEAGVFQEDIRKEYPQTDFLKFESSRQFAASVHKKMGDAAHRLILVGAPEYLLQRSSFVLGGGKKIKITEAIRNIFADFQKRRGDKGERIVAVAFKDMNEKVVPRSLKENPKEFHDKGIVFAGFILLSDPIRADAKKAVLEAQDAGIRVIMVTGDNAATALRVAETVGIWQKNDPVVLGADFEGKSVKEIKTIAARASVFARMLPQNKQRLIEILQESGEVVAMTGDGINDAPALRKADIGIAVGSGTDVAKESADLILIENGLGIIVFAVKTGRKIIDNLQKILAYLFSTSFSEIFLVSGAFALGGPLPLLPAQILWINIIEESFMNFAFAFEPE
ncbi:MAG: HAD-IC family P-type ATPase, partial [Parcubacteria group bacterium]|nr:HAD-IC family P-type ATPase [Parcubacteria group bacterium]